MEKKKGILIAVIICIILPVIGLGISHAIGNAERNEVNVKLPSASGADFVDTLSDVMKNHYGASDELYCKEMRFTFDSNGNTTNAWDSDMQIFDAETGTGYVITRSMTEDDNPSVNIWVSYRDENHTRFEFLPAKSLFEVFRNVNFAELTENQTGVKYTKINVKYGGETIVKHEEYKEADAFDFRIPTYIYKDGEVKQVSNSGEIKEDYRMLDITYNDDEGGVNVIIGGDEINMINLLVPIG